MVVPKTATTMVAVAPVRASCGVTVRKATSPQSICTVKTTPT